MKRREFLRQAGIGMLGMIAGGAAAANGGPRPKRPPNFLFVLTDQQRWDAVGAYGNRYVHTPNLDRMARNGVRFANSYVAQAVCSPSRASIMSGLYPTSHLVIDNVYGIDDVTSMPEYNMAVTWPLLLQKAGYRTGWIGKWHLGERAPKCFDEWHGFNSLLPHWLGKPYESKYRSDAETDQGLKFLEENRERPFALCQSYYPPHTPYTAPKEHWKYYENSPLPGAMEYWAACSDIDWNVGRLMAKLRDLDLLDSTVVMFTSDHGEQFGKRPGGENKRTAYDESARVPLIFHHPVLARGGRIRREELVSNVDLMPTILEVAGVEAPTGLHGTSLVPLLQGENVSWRDAVVIQNRESMPLRRGKRDEGGCSSRAVRTKEWKLILRDKLSVRAKKHRELYDMLHDPNERASLYGPERAGDIKPILERLEAWAGAVEDAKALELATACRKDLGLPTSAEVAR